MKEMEPNLKDTIIIFLAFGIIFVACWYMSLAINPPVLGRVHTIVIGEGKIRVKHTGQCEFRVQKGLRE